MENIQTELLEPQKKFRTSKKNIVLGVLFSFLLLSFITAVVILIQTIPTTVNISEALSTNTTSLSFTGFVGDNITNVVFIENAASVSLIAALRFDETNNSNNISYTTNLPMTNIIVAPGTNAVSVTFTSSGVGQVTGNIILERV